jgi:Protein of unknown function (DUF3311)
MAPPAPPAKRAVHRPAAVTAVAVMLTVTIMGSLWVPLFARTQPELGGFPFFYWYQLILVPVTSVLLWICFLLLRPKRRRGAPSRGASPQGAWPQGNMHQGTRPQGTRPQGNNSQGVRR